MKKIHKGIIIVGCILAVSLCIIYNISLWVGFFTGVLLSATIFAINGHSIADLTKMTVKGIIDCYAVYVIILFIGAIIAVWMTSGIIPTLIYYGFNYIGDINFLLACFLITSTISLVMGTALGTFSTIGMVLLAIGKGVSIPFPLVLGAVISGAFIADKISPMGSMINLTLRIVDVQYRELVKHMAYTILPTMLITSLIYYLLGLSYGSEIDLAKIESFQSSIAEAFVVSPLFLLVPLLIIIMSAMGIKVMINMTMGLLSAIAIGVVFQQISIPELLNTIIFGYQGSTGIGELDSILKGGGILLMLEVVLIISGAVGLNSIFAGTHFIDPAINRISSSIKAKKDLIAKTGFLSIFFTTISDASVGVLVPGKFLQSKFDQLKVPRVTLARTVADTGTSIAPLIPWNVNTVVITGVTGVSVFEYGPYVFLCILSPMITILAGYIGKTSMKSAKKINSTE